MGRGGAFLLHTRVVLKPFYFGMLLCQLLVVCQGMRVTHPLAPVTVWSLLGTTRLAAPGLPGSPSL